MVSYEFVKGLPVITMAEGKQIGKIDDNVVDPERKAVSWLRLHKSHHRERRAFGRGA